jgi:16S rRNA (guanine527-N7)-methyltransferase
MTAAPQQLRAGLAELAIDLPAATQEQLLAYLALLAKWNKTFSLTALRDPEKAVSHHLLDSLAILPYLPTEADSLLDVGSGGGQPGIPLAICRPELTVALADSNQKKVAFLQQAAIELRLANVRAHAVRIEQWQPKNRFAIITSRAFAELATFVGLTRHLLAPGGRWLAMKGVWPHEEIAALPAGVEVEAVHPLLVPGVEGARHLIVLREV